MLEASAFSLLKISKRLRRRLQSPFLESVRQQIRQRRRLNAKQPRQLAKQFGRR